MIRMPNCFVPCCLLLAMANVAQVVPAAEPTARDIVLTRVQPSGQLDANFSQETGWQSLRGLRYQVLLVSAAGTAAPVSPQGPFRTGDRFRIRVEAYCDLWIYVTNEDADGVETLLLPERGEQHLQVKKGDAVVVPPDGQFRLTNGPGEEKFRLLVSPLKLDWANPAELFQLRAGAQLQGEQKLKAEAQDVARTKSIAAIKKAQAELPVVEASLPDYLKEVKPTAGRSKDVVLKPRADTNGQDVLLFSSDRANNNAFVVEIKLPHQP